MGKQIGYTQLLRQNKEFRRLFIANEISFIGDWFTVIALFILAGKASDDSPLAIAGVLASRSFSLALFTPFTGMLADRFSRRGLMVLSNVLSFGILIVVLLTGDIESAGLGPVYGLAVVIVAARAVHDPAEYAYLPNICNENELLTSNALASGGWSVALGVGAAIGGLTIAEFGITTALWIDTTTFLVAALMLSMLPHGGPDSSERGVTTPRVVFHEMIGGWKYILSSPPLRRVVFAKGLWASGGGAQILLLILIGAEAGFGEIAAGVGVLFMVRGFGSGFGPIAGRPLMANMRLRPYLLGLAVGTCGAFYVGVSLVEWGGFMLVLIFLAHAASGLNWVLSTTLLQERSADEWRGRVAGTDHLGITLMMGISAIAGGYILTVNILDLRELIAVTGMVQITLCILWIALVSGPEKQMLQA